MAAARRSKKQGASNKEFVSLLSSSLTQPSHGHSFVVYIKRMTRRANSPSGVVTHCLLLTFYCLLLATCCRRVSSLMNTAVPSPAKGQRCALCEGQRHHKHDMNIFPLCTIACEYAHALVRCLANTFSKFHLIDTALEFLPMICQGGR